MTGGEQSHQRFVDECAQEETERLGEFTPAKRLPKGKGLNCFTDQKIETSENVTYVPFVFNGLVGYAPKPALVLAGKHNPELLNEYVAVEQRIGHKFTLKVSMAEVKQAVECGEAVGDIQSWRM
jgi:hypothetical protein